MTSENNKNVAHILGIVSLHIFKQIIQKHYSYHSFLSFQAPFCTSAMEFGTVQKGKHKMSKTRTY